jgi:hypothetical protein
MPLAFWIETAFQILVWVLALHVPVYLGGHPKLFFCLKDRRGTEVGCKMRCMEGKGWCFDQGKQSQRGTESPWRYQGLKSPILATITLLCMPIFTQGKSLRLLEPNVLNWVAYEQESCFSQFWKLEVLTSRCQRIWCQVKSFILVHRREASSVPP